MKLHLYCDARAHTHTHRLLLKSLFSIDEIRSGLENLDRSFSITFWLHEWQLASWAFNSLSYFNHNKLVLIWFKILYVRTFPVYSKGRVWFYIFAQMNTWNLFEWLSLNWCFLYSNSLLIERFDTHHEQFISIVSIMVCCYQSNGFIGIKLVFSQFWSRSLNEFHTTFSGKNNKLCNRIQFHRIQCTAFFWITQM